MLALFIVIDTYERIIVIDPRSRIGMSFHSSRILVPISSVIVVVLYSALYFSLLSTATTSQWTPPSAPYSLMTLANSAVSLFSYIRMAIEGISILFSLCLDYYLSAKLVQLLFAKAKEGGGGANNTSGNNLFSNGGGGGGGGTGVGGGSSSGGGTSGNGNDGVGIRGHTRQKLRMPPLQRQNFENMKLHDSAILSGANNSSGNILPAADQASTESSNHSKQNSSGRGKNNSSSNTGKKGKKSSSKSGGGGGGSSGAKNSFNTSLAKARQRQERQESKRKIRYKIAVTTTVYLSIMFVLDLVMFGSLLCTAAYPSLTDYYAQLLFILVGNRKEYFVTHSNTKSLIHH